MQARGSHLAHPTKDNVIHKTSSSLSKCQSLDDLSAGDSATSDTYARTRAASFVQTGSRPRCLLPNTSMVSSKHGPRNDLQQKDATSEHNGKSQNCIMGTKHDADSTDLSQSQNTVSVKMRNKNNRDNDAQSKSKAKRLLPNVPNPNIDFETRRKRFSAEILKKVERAAKSSQHSHVKSENGNVESDAGGDVKYKTSLKEPKDEDTKPDYKYSKSNGSRLSCNENKIRTTKQSPAKTISPKNKLVKPTACHYGGKESQFINNTIESKNNELHTSQKSVEQLFNDVNLGISKPISTTGRSKLVNRMPDSVPSRGGHSHVLLRSELDKKHTASVASKQPTSDTSFNIAHPSLHRILKTCNLLSVTIENTTNSLPDWGIELFESIYLDWDTIERRTSFRSPQGRRPIIGRRKSAFVPVTGSSPEITETLSLMAVDKLKENSLAGRSDQLQPGDYILEVNGVYVGNESLDTIRLEVLRRRDSLELVVARPH